MQEEVAARMQQLGSFVRAQRRSQHLSLRRLSEASGISNPYLSQIERGLRKPSAEVLQQIARALAVPVEDLYIQAGILDAPDDDDLIERIRREHGLSAVQRDALVQLYLQFRGNSPDPGEAPAAG